jgi:hypothetical protein
MHAEPCAGGDVFGIHKHIVRQFPGGLANGFKPRNAKVTTS